jgi:hypothetical protein
MKLLGLVRRPWLAISAAALLAISLTAAEQSLPAGIRIPVILTKSISANLAVGAPVEAETTAEVKLPGSLGMIPKGARITGHVSLAAPYNKKESRLAVVLERVEGKGGTILMRGFIVGKLKARNSALGKGPGAIYGAQVVGPGSSISGLGTVSAVEQIPIDRNCKLIQSDNPDIGSEVVSREGDVAMEIGSTFDVLTVEN